MAVFRPDLLSVMTRLQRLRVDSRLLLPRRPPVWEDAAGADAAGSAAASAFLAALGGMTDLVSLVVKKNQWECHTPRGWEAAPAAAFRVLTASSKLQEFVVEKMSCCCRGVQCSMRFPPAGFCHTSHS